jgi:transposase
VEEVDEQELHVERVAALDLGKAALEACVRVPHESRPGRRLQEVRGYATTTGALLELADWLQCWGVTRCGDGIDVRLLEGRLLAAGGRRV